MRCARSGGCEGGRGGAAVAPRDITARLQVSVEQVSVERAAPGEAHAHINNMAKRLFTRKEITELNCKTETLFIIDNVVYNVTKFLDEHPGGHEVLVNVSGKDASEDFDDVGHSYDAKELMKKYIVGELVEADRVETKKRQIKWEDNKGDDETNFLSSWKFPVLIGLLMTVLYSYLLG